MNSFVRESPINGPKWISIHDMHLSKIVCKNNSVVFCFDEGYNLIENGRLFKTGPGSIELLGCSTRDLSCHIIERKVSRKGAILYGRPISIEEINKRIGRKNKWVRIDVELYDHNHMYWRGEMLPYDRITRKKLAPFVTIDIIGFFSMVYSWR